MKVLSDAHFKVMPWKNGKGTTTELFKFPQESDIFDIRISTAEITTDGPFSIFENVDRWLIILTGKGIHLEFPQKKIELTNTSSPLFFQGETPAYCKLIDGNVTDFNFMLRRGIGIADIRLAQKNEMTFNKDSLYFFIFETKERRLIILTCGESFKIQNESSFIIRVDKAP